MQITTRIAHGTDVIHSHAGILPFEIPAREQSPASSPRLSYNMLAQLPPFKIKFVQVDFARFESKFLRLLVAGMTHDHVEQYPTCVFADHAKSFARQPPLAVIAK
jgi:hypothetical protein